MNRIIKFRAVPFDAKNDERKFIFGGTYTDDAGTYIINSKSYRSLKLIQIPGISKPL